MRVGKPLPSTPKASLGKLYNQGSSPSHSCAVRLACSSDWETWRQKSSPAEAKCQWPLYVVPVVMWHCRTWLSRSQNASLLIMPRKPCSCLSLCTAVSWKSWPWLTTDGLRFKLLSCRSFLLDRASSLLGTATSEGLKLQNTRISSWCPTLLGESTSKTLLFFLHKPNVS